MKNYKKGAQCLNKNNALVVGQLLNNYSQYLYNTRGLAQQTIVDYCRRAKEFLLLVAKDNKVTLDHIRPEHVLKFILEIAKERSANYAQKTTYALRSFFRYLRQTHEIHRELEGILLSVANRKKTSYPEVLSVKQIDQLLRSCDRKTAKGMRDYVLILLMSSLGLRACEVCNLNLDDIDLNNAEIIIRGKGSLTRMPLFEGLGKPLITYIKHGRPTTSNIRVFIALTPPFRPFTTSGVRSMFRSALKHIGLQPKIKGTHLLRHTFAMQLLEQGATLVEIGTVLKHKDLNTTAIYARANFSKLVTIALPWPIKGKKGGFYE
jgi:integrase/recombinase XerD